MNRATILQQAVQCLQNQQLPDINSLSQLIQRNAHDADAIRLIGMAYQQTGNFSEAMKYFLALIKLLPTDTASLINAGTCCSNLGRLDDAKKCFQKAINLNSKEAMAHSNLGFVLYQQHDFLQAQKSLKKAIKLNPKFPLAHNNLGHVLVSLGNWAEAANHYTRALTLDPSTQDALSTLVYALRTLCRWKDISKYETLLLKQSDDLLSKGLPSHITPFVSVFLKISSKQQNRILVSYAQNKKSQAALSPLPNRSKAAKSEQAKLRVGYLSSAFRDHATCHLAHTLFELHDNKNFEIYAYAATHPDLNNNYVKQIKAHTDKLIDLSDNSDYDAALKIQHDEVDILVDLDGYIERNRHMIAAYRPAPIQVNYLGFPGSMGADWNDYIIGDKIVTPIELDDEIAEHPVRLPDCYQINNYHVLPTAEVPHRSELGLPEDALVYCCFNISRKIEPEVFTCWMNILKSVPRSVLWFLSDTKESRRNLQKEANSQGIDSSRLIFAARVPPATHLARQKAADLFLDTFYCNAHTTASDALWSGLPVVTCIGDTFANRVAASIVTTAGIPECIASSHKEYETIAIELGENSKSLEQVKKKLLQNNAESRLFDTPRYVHNLERAYQEMWQQHLTGTHKPIDLK